jgi:1-acyl-sn-glycerol-3-phosphate acyltransferase
VGDGQGSGPDDALDVVLAAVREIAGDVRPARSLPEIRLDSRLDADLGLDSLAIAVLLVRLEERFATRLPETALAEVHSPRDLLALVARHVSPPPPPVRRRPTPVTVRTAAPSCTDAGTLAEVLLRQAEARPDTCHLRILAGSGDDELTYGELLVWAGHLAAGLRERGVGRGASVAIMLPTGRDYFVAFAGVLLAGAVPTPIYPPGRPSALEEHLERQRRILDDAGAVVLVTVPEASRLGRLLAPRVPTLRYVATVAELTAAGGAGVPAVIATPTETALLQYTSGSTGDPKGVVLSHANLMANIRAMGQAGAIAPDDVFVSWLPLYHDMGLIGSWLVSLTFGIPFVVTSPLAFLTRPARWLWAIDDHRGTVSGGPNFGYELCLRRTTDDDLDGLDLSSWRLAFNGAEPVSPDTLERFTARFAAYGFDPGAMTPVYGLAESSVALTVPPLRRGPLVDRVAREPLTRSGRAQPAAADDPTARRVVSCGPPLPGHRVRIADRDGRTLEERREGRVEFRGPSTTSGYLGDPVATRRLFDGDWLDSGDLGYLADGELYLTGRSKDLIIRAGRNLHPSELEDAVGAVAGIRRGCVVAFASDDPDRGTERLVVVAETRSPDATERSRMRREVDAAVVERAGTPPDEVVLVPPGTVPKTSSGKVRRAEARVRFETGRLVRPPRAVWRQVARVAAASLPARAHSAGVRVREGAYALWASVVFAAVAAVVWPAVAVLPDVGRRWRAVHRGGRLLLRCTGVRLSIDGEALPDPPFVVAANHASFLDPLVLSLVLEQPAVFTAVGGLADRRLVRAFLRRLESHLVGRGDRASGVADRHALTRLVRDGRIVVFFPEGRRSPTPGLEPFRTGAFVVAADAGVPVVPIAITGTRAVLPVDRARPRRGGPITVTVAPAVEPAAPGWAGAVALHRATRAAILERCGEPDLA